MDASPHCRTLTCVMTVLFTFNLQTKLEMSSFICSRDKTGTHDVEMGHVTLTTPTWGIVRESGRAVLRSRTVQSLILYVAN